MLLVPKIYAEIALGFDFLILITSLLFRKPKRRTAKSTPDRRRIKLVGYYIVGSAIVGLVVVHYASFQSYLNYFAGLSIDAFMFYLGLRAVMVRE
jgi:polyferredoxin